MPTPARTSTAQVIAAGREILETDGVDGLTMQRLASAVGVRAPSLYKRVDGRADLVRLIALDVSAELSRVVDAAATTGDAALDLAAIATAFRAFAHAHPEAYALLFRRLPESWRLQFGIDIGSFDALFRTVRALAGPGDELEAARTVVAWAHGFVSMELADAFRLGGDVDRAFAYGTQRLAKAITVPAVPDVRAAETGRPG
jgi:AcrR family transcriptional regulator